MSNFTNPIFVKEFAYRTKINYYNLLNYKPDETNHTPEKVTELLKKMKSLKFDISQRYEVTLAINSLIGLLIFPQQQYYKSIEHEVGFNRLPILKSCMDDNELYMNTYMEYEGTGDSSRKPNKKELVPEDDNKPARILKHMRNAISHERIMIVPESCDDSTITHLRFTDICSFSKNRSSGEYYVDKIVKDRDKAEVFCEFKLDIPIEKLEGVMMEIADYLISFDAQ